LKGGKYCHFSPTKKIALLPQVRTTMQPTLLLADGEWIKILIFLLFVLGPLIGNLFKGDPQARGKAPPRRPKGPPAPAPVPGNARDRLEAEIEGFLRQARGAAEPEREKQPRRREPLPAQPERRPARPPVQAKVLPTQAEPARQVGRRRELGAGVSRHVQEHIEAHPVTEKSARLGRSVGLADENIESHLHQIFDHQLGQFDLSKASPTDPEMIQEGTDAAVWQQVDHAGVKQQKQQVRMDAVRKLLSQPQGMQQAIVISEILGRPRGAE
jgi:hypothetical protein